MVNTVVEVTKDIMSLTVGDILRLNPDTGRFELKVNDEEVGDDFYSHNKFEISLEPYLINKYQDHFQVYVDPKA